MTVNAPRTFSDAQLGAWIDAARQQLAAPNPEQVLAQHLMAAAYRDVMTALMLGAFGPEARAFGAPAAALPLCPDAGLEDQLRALRALMNSGRGGAPAPGPRYTPGPSLADVGAGAVMARGHSGADVRTVQAALNAAGARPPLAEDGLFGPKTQRAVRELEQRMGLAPTGNVDASLLWRLAMGGALEGARGGGAPSVASSSPSVASPSPSVASPSPPVASPSPSVASPSPSVGPAGAYDGRHPAPGTTTHRKSAYNDPPLTNDEARGRSRGTYEQVVNQFAVGHNPRYAVNNGSTYCNIFAWDVTRAMGAEIPHWIRRDGTPAKPFEKGAHELNANDTAHWLTRHGAQHGWRKVSAEEAQQRANEGKPGVAILAQDGGIGHVAVIRPGELTDRGPAIAQAGARNFNEGHVHDVWRTRAPVEYWVHD